LGEARRPQQEEGSRFADFGQQNYEDTADERQAANKKRSSGGGGSSRTKKKKKHTVLSGTEPKRRKHLAVSVASPKNPLRKGGKLRGKRRGKNSGEKTKKLKPVEKLTLQAARWPPRKEGKGAQKKKHPKANARARGQFVGAKRGGVQARKKPKRSRSPVRTDCSLKMGARRRGR